MPNRGKIRDRYIVNPVTLLGFVLVLQYKEKSNSDQSWQTKTFKPEPVEIVWLCYMTKDSSRNSGWTPADVPPPSALNWFNLQQCHASHNMAATGNGERKEISFSVDKSTIDHEPVIFEALYYRSSPLYNSNISNNTSRLLAFSVLDQSYGAPCMWA